MGGSPINRDKNENKVTTISEIFNQRELFRLAIAPEGTRKKVNRWKTGFYHIAIKSNVPIVFCKFDFKTKTVGAFDILTPSGNFKSDMQYIENSFKNFQGKIIENYNPKIY